MLEIRVNAVEVLGRLFDLEELRRQEVRRRGERDEDAVIGGDLNAKRFGPPFRQSLRIRGVSS